MVAVIVLPPFFKPVGKPSSKTTQPGDLADGSSSPPTSTSAAQPETPLPTAWTEREAVTWALENRGRARVQPARGEQLDVYEADQIPTGEFHIESLNVTGLRGEIDSHVARLRGLGSLKELDLSGTELSDAGAAHLERLPTLTSLNVRGCSISDAGLKPIGKLTGLTFLSVGELSTSAVRHPAPRSPDPLVRTSLTDTGLRELHSLAKLETLTVASPNITEAGLSQLVEFCPDLVTLNIEQAPLTDSVLEPLSKLRHLRTLSLIQSKLTDGAIDSVAKLKLIHSLNVQGSQITGDGIRRLQATLLGCRVFGGEYHPKRNLVRVLVQAKGRVHVTLAGGASREITDATFTDLPTEFTSQRIDLRNVRPLAPELLQLPEATELILADSAISPHDIGQLPSLFPVLLVLDLSGTAVTDREITALSTMMSLQRIDLTRTNVTATGIAALKQANLTCEIKWTAQ